MSTPSSLIRIVSASISFTLGATACDEERPPDDGVVEGDSEMDADIDGGSSNDLPSEAEPCQDWGEGRTCDGGMQFCGDIIEGDDILRVWGPCLEIYDCTPGDERLCAEGSEAETLISCGLFEGVPYWVGWPDCENTPLVLSFDGAPIELMANATAFDISGTGICLDTDWPASSTPWLAIDLDRNGFVDGGHELFGSGFVLESGRRAVNGFVALEALDSNRDDRIDRRDARFAELLLWRDEDGDKQSTRWELTSLADERIEGIELGYQVDQRCDARSNCERERSSFTFMAGGTRRVGEVVDIYLACQ